MFLQYTFLLLALLSTLAFRLYGAKSLSRAAWFALMLLGFIVPFAIVALSNFKVERYSYPGYAPLFVLAGLGMSVIWRQNPKVTGRGHYAHRIAVSPDGRYLFVASGDRQKMDPAQDTSNNLGSIVRLNLDGSPAAGNPFAGQAGKAQDIWSWGHRNTLGLAFDAQGRLWNLEHGPAGGDEINLVKKGANYGWPVVSEGDHYDGTVIPPHSTRPEFAAPAISWSPVIAPGDFIIYRGGMFPQWRGQAIIGGMSPTVLVRVAFDGEQAREVARHPMERRIREVVEAPDGSILVLEDKAGARLLRLTPQ